ncbi:MAG: hypothetical protein QGH82_02155 [Candidatus Woesearchaeota archaeon]|nr:hypothetical protein [Candidatus Woesearchaeota archaeon]
MERPRCGPTRTTTPLQSAWLESTKDETNGAHQPHAQPAPSHQTKRHINPHINRTPNRNFKLHQLQRGRPPTHLPTHAPPSTRAPPPPTRTHVHMNTP